MTRTFCIFGASGFVGQHLVARLASDHRTSVRCLSRKGSATSNRDQGCIVYIQGDLLDPPSLEGFLIRGSVVVNLAHLSTGTIEENVRAAQALVGACSRAQVRRVIHLSTAAVAGSVSANWVDEGTPCQARTPYEHGKLTVENSLLESSDRRFELIILRPTAVFGTGGRNVVKLAKEVASDTALLRYLRACFHGRRAMNLVAVESVVEAIRFLAESKRQFDDEIFLVSDDSAATNNYRDVEDCLIRAFRRPKYPFPLIPLPDSIRRQAYRMMGRSNANPYRRYSDQKLRALGFSPPIRFENAMKRYAAHLAAQFLEHGRVYG